jgi:twitching motility protein PilT
MDDLLQEAVMRNASDLHITVGIPPVLRINGSLIYMQRQRLLPNDIESLLQKITTAGQYQQFCEIGELDFSYALLGLGRFRINSFHQRGSVAIVARVIAESVPTLENLGHPEILKIFPRKTQGLVLVTGPTGSGKSTTLAAMIHLINIERNCHIITLEDPIEYLHKHNSSIVNQREVHTDTKSFASGLRSALREDPDVILVGEMRDMETISTAITAAETGHLVFATLHTSDAAQTIDRIMDAFPPHHQQQIRMQLSMSLQGIVSQQLLPRLDQTGRVVALEILIATPAIRNLIREGKTHQIPSIIQTGTKVGMQSMDMALKNLFRLGIVSYEEAALRAVDPETLMR